MHCGQHIAFVPLLLMCCAANAQQSDVTFIVIGKHGNYLQGPSGQRAPEDLSFFSEIFLTTGGDA